MENNKELWKPIVGYEGLYEISNHGRVKSLSQKLKVAIAGGYRIKREAIRKQVKSTHGYMYLTLRKNKKVKTCAVHRLVAKMWIPKINNKPYVNHKDSDKTNNHVDNLEWCTQKENIDHYITNKVKENKPKIILTNEQVVEMRSKYTIESHPYYKIIAEEYNTTIVAVYRVLTYKTFKNV